MPDKVTEVLPFKAGKLKGVFESYDHDEIVDFQQLQSKLNTMLLKNNPNASLENVKFFVFKPLPKNKREQMKNRENMMKRRTRGGWGFGGGVGRRFNVYAATWKKVREHPSGSHVF